MSNNLEYSALAIPLVYDSVHELTLIIIMVGKSKNSMIIIIIKNWFHKGKVIVSQYISLHVLP